MAEVSLYEKLRTEVFCTDLTAIDIPVEARRAFNDSMGEWIAGDAHGFLLAPEDRDGHCHPAEFVRTIALRLDALANAYNSHVTQSPIEDMLLGALLWLDSDFAGFPDFDALGIGPVRYDDGTYSLKGEIHLWLTAQAPIKNYKADFLIWVAAGAAIGGIVIECDGHAFHEKNKEQAARDKKRDREILAAGYPVLRFTGSEIYKDTKSCVEQVKGVLQDLIYKVGKEGGHF